MNIVSRRLDKVSPLFFASLDERIAAMGAAGLEVIRLDVGSPDLPPQADIVAALTQSAAQPDRHGYGSHTGPTILREAWAQLYQREFAVDLDAQTEILPLLGSKEGIFHLTLALVNPGDVVLIPDPAYPTYARAAIIAGGDPYFFSLLPERDYLPDLQAIPTEIARKAKIMWLNYPNNPTSATASLDFFAEALAFSRQHGIVVCHDAAYSQITYEGYLAPSILQNPTAKQLAVEFNSLSKSHNMAGWRVGVAVGNAVALRALATLKTHADSGHFKPVLEAATVAMTGDQSWLQERNHVYQQRRDVVVKALNGMGLPAATPKASLYVWCQLPQASTSTEFCRAALENAHVSLTPGIIFGERGEGYLRISLTSPLEHIRTAMQRLERWMTI